MILRYQNLSESFLQKHICKLSNKQLQILFKFQRVSETFIENFLSKNKVPKKLQTASYQIKLEAICCYQKLSEAFIEKYEDQLDWLVISREQDLSEEFIYRNENKVNFVILVFSYFFKKRNYSEKFQYFLLYKILDNIKKGHILKSDLTPYMRKQLSNLKVLF